MPAAKIKELLSEYALTPNKALGQNFLCDDGAAWAIAESFDIVGGSVLEIGPGLGSLTEPLLERAGRVTAVEIDKRMVDALSARFSGNDKLNLLHADFLKVSDADIARAVGGTCVVMANLPYYVTTPICMKLLCAEYKVSGMTLMLQREAAERFFAKPSDRQYGPLTVMSNFYFEISTLMELSPDMYYPQPEVSSSVVVLKRRVDVERLKALPTVLENCFRMRRKTIYNNLKSAYGEARARSALYKAGIDETARAEALDAPAFARLSQALYEE